MSCRDPRQAAEELEVFRAFLKAYPSLESEVVDIIQPCQPFPDITIRLQDESETDFELGEWLDDWQVEQAIKIERIESPLMDAIGEQGTNGSDNFRCVRLALRADVGRFNPRDGAAFRLELFRLIAEIDRCWPFERHWHSIQGRVCREFEDSPTLKQYLQSVTFSPLRYGTKVEKRWPAGQPWIVFESRGGSYSHDTALKALLGVIHKKQSHYGNQKGRPVHLLVYYLQALRYNTPYTDIETPEFKDMATLVAGFLDGEQLIFEKVYLLNAFNPDLQAYEIYPQFVKCQ